MGEGGVMEVTRVMMGEGGTGEQTSLARLSGTRAVIARVVVTTGAPSTTVTWALTGVSGDVSVSGVIEVTEVGIDS